MPEGDVIPFPKNKIVRHVPVEETVPILEKMKINATANFAEELVSQIVDVLLDEMTSAGIDTQEEHFQKDFSMAVEAVRATVYRNLELEHSMHDFVDTSVVMHRRDPNTGELLEPEKKVDSDE